MSESETKSKRPKRFGHYRDRALGPYAPAICGTRGGLMGYYADEIDCPECLVEIEKAGIKLKEFKPRR